ncbi:PAS domain S-box protein [Mucilaginibacter achroorhodeus]|uniref:histidine kinase n=1 Tax=Mucilaginibacter achroorhodeus TaxID=2599294 RepID=A0A563U1J8_9SPHI|nr:chemotaxis protein CheB [Mucilaginibacter achroorhodeus]TWR25515.1 PAS domain S-box protein [Mucilaginibacter achroorhodeus]
MKDSRVKFPEDKILEHYIIAIGASAGGLEAIHEFFDHMPPNSGFTFVVIQHLSPDYKSLLVELVSKHTHMKVYEAEDNTTLQRDCVYIIPTKKLMTIRGGRLRLADKIADKSPNTAIDTFLFTLAKDQKDKAIAIILSGTGTDGTKGIEAVKECGGMVIVQDPATAKFDGMPNSAITSGNADYILAPDTMHTEVYNYVSQNHKPPLEETHPDDTVMNEIFKLVHNGSGQDFNLYKTPTILRRIDRRMAAVNVKELKDYVTLLHEKPSEVKLLAKDFLINVTKFFRDQPAFDILAKDIIPKLVDGKVDGEMLKIWVCACSTGEEAYSIAILFNEELQKTGKKLELKIFATDVDESSIEIASRNRYPLTIAKEIPPVLLKKYFIKENKGYSVLPSIRRQIVFAKHNVIKSPPFIKNDLVTCRNMLIYMNTLLQQKVLSTFHYSLNRNGYLFLGSSENATSLKEGLTEISGKWKIYQKTGTINYGLHHTYTSVTPNLRYADKKLPFQNGETSRSLDEEFRDLILEEFGTVGIFIDKTYTVKETIGNFNQFLTLPNKKLDLNILNMLSREVSVVLNTAIRKAWKENKKTHVNRVRIKRGKEDILLQITVKPPDTRSPNGYTLLMFTEAKTEHQPKDGIELPPVAGEHQSEYLMEMEAELSETRVNLQMAVEEMETTNEELQSSNEELLSANEELQSGNEELQSLNEELHTLNTEHQLKIRELLELNEDLDNYFRSTDIGQIFIDANLRIRKFNPAAVKMVNLIEADIGRPINHISSNIKYDNLTNDIHTVLASGQVIEKEIELLNGKNNLMRIMPYLKKDKSADGVVISFVDISVITELNNIINGVFNASSAAILAFRQVHNQIGKAVDFNCIAYNNAALDILKKDAASMERHPSIKEFPDLGNLVSFDQYVKIATGGKPIETELKTADDRWFQAVLGKMNDGFVISLTNITERKQGEQKLKHNYNELITAREGLRNLNNELEQRVLDRTRELTESEERFKLVSKATNDTIWDWSLVNNTMWRSENFATMFGYEINDEIADVNNWFEKIHPEDRERVQKSIYSAINNHQDQWTAEYRFLKADGKYATILDRCSILEDEFKTPYRLVGSIIDISRLIETEKRLDESESKFRKVFESNMIGMVFSNMDGRIIETNDAFLNMLGYTREEVEADPLNWKEITPEEYHEISLWAVEQLKQHGVVPPFEKQYRKHNGDRLWVLMGSAVLRQDDTPINSVSYIIDITKQKQAESRRKELLQLVKKQQDEFYSIFTNAPALITIKRGPDLIYEFVNKAFEKFDGQKSYLGRKSLDVHPELKDSELFKVERHVFKTGKTVVKNAFHVYRFDHKTGEKKDCWFDFIYAPVFAEDGGVDGIAFFGFDVTDLIKGRQAAEELMQKKDEFMSIASHELKTPITSIKGSLQILKRMIDKAEGKDATLASFIDKANKQTGKLTTLVDDLLDVTKIQEGKMVLNYDDFDAAAMVKECMEEVYAQNSTHRIEFKADCEMRVHADKVRLEQVVTNFLTNAIKYSPKADKVTITCDIDDKNFKVSVTDFGIGIPDDKKDFLFDRFYRVQESSSHVSGLGLGLYISAEIIKRHKGEIGVESKANIGSTFWFTIPIKNKA